MLNTLQPSSAFPDRATQHMRLMFAHWMIACTRTQSMNGRPCQEGATSLTVLFKRKGKVLVSLVEEKWRTRHWTVHVMVALGYALIHQAVIAVLFHAPWPFVAGLRIACLLLMPYRYWPALVAGEIVPLSHFYLGNADKFGMTWALLASIPPIAVAMPVVWWFRERAALFPSCDLVDVKKLLWCVLALSALWAAIRCATALTAHTPTGPYQAAPGIAFRFFINFYMVVLLVTPWVVMARIHCREASRSQPSWRSIATSPLARDVLIATFLIAALTLLHKISPETIKPAIMLVLFFAALGLTLKHGWRASVLGGTLCLISISLLVEWKPNPSTQPIQAVLAFTITCLYVFGARLSMQMRLLEQLQRETLQTQQIAKRSLVFGEQRLQQTSQALECVAGTLRMDYARVLQRASSHRPRWGTVYCLAE